MTTRRDINIGDQVERFISASIILGVGLQRHISDIEEFRFKNQNSQRRAAPGCPSRVCHAAAWFSPALKGFDRPALRNPNTLLPSILELIWKGVCQPQCREVGMALCVLQLFPVSRDLWLGRKSSHRSALSQSRASQRSSVVLQIQGTGNHFEAIIVKSFPSFSHVPQEQEGRALSSRKYLAPIDISGNKALKYFGESGSETLIAGMHLWETVTTKAGVYLAGSFLTPTTKACSGRVTQHLSGLWTPCRQCEWNPHPLRLHVVAHTTGF